VPHVRFILRKRPRSALAYQYLGNALLGLGRYSEAERGFRVSLAYNPFHVPALGNLGVALVHLGRQQEALQIFVQIIDTSDNPAELWPAYNNIGRIYESWGRNDLSKLYRQKATDLSAAAAERMTRYAHRRDPNDKVAKLLDAFVYAEIKMEEESPKADTS
jgi:tetratricopeptide (TPR) repeat protein